MTYADQGGLINVDRRDFEPARKRRDTPRRHRPVRWHRRIRHSLRLGVGQTHYGQGVSEDEFECGGNHVFGICYETKRMYA